MVGFIPEFLTLLLTPILKYICMSNAICVGLLGTSPQEDGVGPREKFSLGPGPEKRVKNIFALDISGHLGNVILFSEKQN